MAVPPADQWYYMKGQQRYGPVPRAHLMSVVAPADLVWVAGMPSWVPASSVPGLIPIPVPPVQSTPVADDRPRTAWFGRPLAWFDSLSTSHARIMLFVLVSLILLFVFTGLMRTQRWEYKVESVSDGALDVVLDLWGDSGWELVTARRVSERGYDQMKYEMIFKRRK